MAVTFEQRMQKQLVGIVEDAKNTTAQRLEAARYLLEIKAGKPLKTVKTKARPTGGIDALLGSTRPPPNAHKPALSPVPPNAG
jgi:hypothetical protein